MNDRKAGPPLVLVVLLGAVLALLLALALAWYLRSATLTPERAGTLGSSGIALVGGPFSLTDQRGKRVDSAELAGRWMLITFGYTFCPDVCPTSLANMTQALERLAERAPAKAEQVVPVFITVDPRRDSAAQLAAYASHFHPRLLALTGSTEEIAAAAKAYRVYYSTPAEGEGEDYLLDHSAFIYLMGPDGAYVTHFPPSADATTLAAALEERVGS